MVVVFIAQIAAAAPRTLVGPIPIRVIHLLRHLRRPSPSVLLAVLLGIHQMSGPPIALHKAPGAVQVHRVPGVPKPVVVKAETRLVAGRLAVAFDHHTVQAGIAERVEVDFIYRKLNAKLA